MSTPPPSTTTPFSDTPLHHSLNQLALSHNPLDDLLAEDLSLEDSFELTTSSSSPSVPVVVSPRTSRRIVLQRKEEEERGDEVSNPTVVVVEERVYSYTGTMGVLPPSPPSLTAPIHSRPTPSYPSSRPTYDDEEGEGGGGEEEVFEIDEEDEGLAEEDQRRRRTLREERDDLRIMNGYLEEIVKGLEMAESKMLTFKGTISTTHELLELYVKICSQAEHTQQLLLDRSWHGVKADIEVQKAIEALAAQEAAEAEEAALRSEAALRHEEQLRAEAIEAQVRKATATTPARRGVATRGRAGLTRGIPSTRGGSIPSTTTTTTMSSGISRGTGGGVTGVRGVRGLRSRVVGRGSRGSSSTIE